jgi:hypothetical protein
LQKLLEVKVIWKDYEGQKTTVIFILGYRYVDAFLVEVGSLGILLGKVMLYKKIKDPVNILQTIMEIKYSSARFRKPITFFVN